MKPTTYLLLLTLLFSACKKDDGEPEPQPVEEEHPYNTCLPTTVISTHPNVTTTTNLFYYSNGKLRKDEYVGSDGKKRINEYLYDPSGNLLKKVSRTEGNESTFSKNYIYDSDGNLIYEYNQGGSERTNEFIYTYDLLNRLTRKIEKRSISQVMWDYTYDATGPALSMRLTNESLPGNEQETFFKHDQKSNITEEKLYVYLYGDTTFYRWNQYEYDAQGHQTKVININPNDSNYKAETIIKWDTYGNETDYTTYDYNGNVNNHTALKRTYDDKGNLIKTERYYNGELQFTEENIITCWD